MSKNFENKTILITGGTAGIGLATAIAFAEQGANVVVSGRREPEGIKAVEQIEAAGGSGLFVRADVAVEADVAHLVAAAVERFGKIDVAFNNAGVHLGSTPILETTAEQYQQVFDVNVKGVLLSMKHEIAAMQKSGGGVVVNNASVLGIRPTGDSAIYDASKSAVIGLTKSVAKEFASKGVRVNAICPAVIETEMTAELRENQAISDYVRGLHPIGRFGKPEEIAAAVLYLCSPGAGFTTGLVMAVDGGFSI